MQIAEDLGLGRLAGSLALPIVCQTDNEALRTGGAHCVLGSALSGLFPDVNFPFQLEQTAGIRSGSNRGIIVLEATRCHIYIAVKRSLNSNETFTLDRALSRAQASQSCLPWMVTRPLGLGRTEIRRFRNLIRPSDRMMDGHKQLTMNGWHAMCNKPLTKSRLL
jgi:hypothetical protein